MRKRDKYREAEVRLQEWGEWIAKPVPGLSFPRMSAEQRAREGRGGAVNTSPLYYPNQRAREVHMVLLGAPADLRVVAELHYVDGKSTQRGSRQMGLSAEAYRSALDKLLEYVLKRI